MLRYPVLMEPDTNGTVLVSFPDFPEAHTFGDDEHEALARAADLLQDVLSDYIENRRDVPRPSRVKKGAASLILPVLTEAKVGLYQEMRASRVRKAERVPYMESRLIASSESSGVVVGWLCTQS